MCEAHRGVGLTRRSELFAGALLLGAGCLRRGTVPVREAMPPDTGKAGRRYLVKGGVVTLMERGNVDTVIVAGQVRKWRGALEVDLEGLRQRVTASRDFLFETIRCGTWRTGFPSESSGPFRQQKPTRR